MLMRTDRKQKKSKPNAPHSPAKTTGESLEDTTGLSGSPSSESDECAPCAADESSVYMPKESADFLKRIGATFNSGALFRLVLTAQNKRHFTFLTSGFEQLFGVPTIAARNDANVFYRLIFAEDVTGHMKREQQSIDHDEPLASEVRMQSLSSGTRWVQFRAHPSYDTNGNRCLDGLLIDVTLQKQVEDQLREMATTDALTGLTNRRSFMQTAERELHKASRYNRPLSMIMVDADHFKRVNDSYGHEVGDDVLIALAKALAQSARKDDIAARLGGEEFAILLPETTPSGAIDLAERVRKNIEAMGIASGEHTLRITVSIGVSTSSGRNETVSKLLKRSDDALYEAKQNGRNKVCYIPAPPAAT